MPALTPEAACIVARIRKLREMCVIHRYLYYVKSEPVISDYQYDMFERELKDLAGKHPDLANLAEIDMPAPERTVGSSNIDDYSRRIEQLAESILAYHQRNSSVITKAEGK